MSASFSHNKDGGGSCWAPEPGVCAALLAVNDTFEENFHVNGWARELIKT